MKHCPNCLRHTIPDVIKATRFCGDVIGPFTICTWCGWWLDTPRELEAHSG